MKERKKPGPKVLPLNPVNEGKQNYFFVRGEKEYIQIAFEEIIYVRGRNGYIQIVCEQRTVLVMNTLVVIANMLPQHLFCRVHHSYIAALWRIEAFDRGYIRLKQPSEENPFKQGLARTQELPVGFRYRQGLRNSVSIMLNKSGGRGLKKEKDNARYVLQEEELEIEN